MAEMVRMVRRCGAALVLAAAVLALSSGSALGAAKPDLVVTALSSAPATASPGGGLQVADSVKNRGSRKAKASTTRYYLSSDRKRQAGDLMLAGHRAVRPLKPRKTSTGTAAVTVPSFAGGSYFVLACADDRRKVREAKERNNCRASVTQVQVASALTNSPGQGTTVNDDPAPSLSINDQSTTEGNSGTTLSTFTVSLSAPSGNTVTVDYATADGTATAPGDYSSASGTITFAPGATIRTVTVLVVGDTLDEPNETFGVSLSGAQNAVIADGQGQGTIVNDDPPSPSINVDPPSLSINDQSTTEGNSGTTLSTFTVSLSAPSGNTVTVDYATADGTATAGGVSATGGKDYTPASGTITFAPGETSRTVTAAVVGDTLNEPNETFGVSLSGAQNAVIADGQGQGTILNDDPVPSLSINDVSLTEGGAGAVVFKNFVFTVSLSAASGNEVTVNFATADGTANTINDYIPTAGTLTFLPGETTKTVTVQVRQDTTAEANDTFFVNLSNAQNAFIADSQGLGTIINDD